ncbi:MAG: cytochrome c3 family protein [Spirochaetota bacterium]|nr:cytochrome c3 family protein [Spirochaetota bacterium]
MNMKIFIIILTSFYLLMLPFKLLKQEVISLVTGSTDIVTISKAIKNNRMTPVQMPHIIHEKADIKCVVCHHKEDNDDRIKICSKCHKGKESEDILHDLCINCHKELKKGPIECTACHRDNK